MKKIMTKKEYNKLTKQDMLRNGYIEGISTTIVSSIRGKLANLLTNDDVKVEILEHIIDELKMDIEAIDSDIIFV